MLRELADCIKKAEEFEENKEYSNALTEYRKASKLVFFKEGELDGVSFDLLHLKILLRIAIIGYKLGLYDDSLWEMNELEKHLYFEFNSEILENKEYLFNLFFYTAKNHYMLEDYKKSYIYTKKAECYKATDEVIHLKNELLFRIKLYR